MADHVLIRVRPFLFHRLAFGAIGHTLWSAGLIEDEATKFFLEKARMAIQLFAARHPAAEKWNAAMLQMDTLVAIPTWTALLGRLGFYGLPNPLAAEIKATQYAKYLDNLHTHIQRWASSRIGMSIQWSMPISDVIRAWNWIDQHHTDDTTMAAIYALGDAGQWNAAARLILHKVPIDTDPPEELGPIMNGGDEQ